MERVRAATGEMPALYARRSFVDGCLGGTKALAKYPVRLARYNSGSAEPSPLPGGSGWDFWQYSEDGTVAGIGPKVCLDVFHGDLAELKRRAPPCPPTDSSAAETAHSRTCPDRQSR
ncbi:GH25 family lysozyme [Streptomyces sp. NPDC046197]|uniref:GH25 family lysozyme n=1 Tax=Streptomyces sp. NPDC046197 TaxID=3154337 RepID=UPI0033C30F89